MSSTDTPESAPDLRARIRPLPVDTLEETFLPFLDLCFNWSMDKPTIPREDLVHRADARHYFAGWGRPGDLAVACFDETGEEIVGLAWLRLAEDGGVDAGDGGPADAAFAAGLSEDPSEAGRTVPSDVLAEADAATEADAGCGKDAESDPAEADAESDGTSESDDAIASATDDPEPADDSEPADAPFAGYGWVAADIPELSIAVLPDHQGEGIGRALLTVLLTLARMSGVEAVSLAVEDGNGAKSLYLDEGFVTVGRNGDSDLLVRQLR